MAEFEPKGLTFVWAYSTKAEQVQQQMGRVPHWFSLTILHSHELRQVHTNPMLYIAMWATR